MRGILRVANYEIKQLFNDHSLILTFLLAPIMYAFFLGSIYINKDIEEVPIAILDLDNSPTSRSLIRAMDATQQINIAEHLTSFSEGVDEINKLNIQGFVYFPNGFEAQLLSMKGTDLAVYLNTSQFLPSNNPNKDLQKVLITAGAGIRLKYYMAHGVDPENATQIVMPLQPDVRGIANPLNTYGGFLLPGLFILILHQTLLFGIGESFTKDRQKKALPQILGLANGQIHIYFIGKLSFYLLLYFAYFLLFLTTIFPIFNLNVHGSWDSMLLIALAMSLAVLMFGVFISSFFRTQVGFLEIIAFSSYPLFLMSGFSWPFQSMPVWIQYLAQFSPMTPFMQAFTKVLELGADWEHVAFNVIHLILLFILYGFAAMYRWSRIADKQLRASAL